MIARSFFLLIALLGVLPGSAGALSAGSACPEGNLLGGLAPLRAEGVARAGALTDGVLALDGDSWNGTGTATLAPDGILVFDLGRAVGVAALLLQADADNVYAIDTSLDGRRWDRLTTVPASIEGPGLRVRRGYFEATARYVRVTARELGSGLGEIQLFCAPPPDLVPDLTFRRSREILGWRGLLHGPWSKLLLAAGAMLLFVARGRCPPGSFLDGPTPLVGLVVLGVLAWTDRPDDAEFVHLHEVVHYGLGSEYAPELGYDGLYRCALEAEGAGGYGVDPLRPVRDLRTDRMATAADVAEPGACAARFGDRWPAFVRDVGGLRDRMAPADWRGVFADHGYNAPPTWSALGATLVPAGELGAAADALAWLDPPLYAVCLALLWWGFGLEATALAMVLLAVGQPWAYEWTAGAFGRSLWLVGITAGLSCAARGRSTLAGAGIALAALLRVFPAALLLGPLVAWARTRDGGWRRPAMGAAAMVLALVPLATAHVGIDGWGGFASNTQKHEASAFSNKMGVTTALSWHPDRSAEALYDWTITDPSAPWAEARAQTVAARRTPIWIARLLVLGLLLAVCLRPSVALWEQLALGVGALMVGPELSSYYWVFFVFLAPLAIRRLGWTAIALGAVAVTQIAELLPLSFETPWIAASAALLAAWTAIAVGRLRSSEPLKGSGPRGPAERASPRRPPPRRSPGPRPAAEARRRGTQGSPPP